MQRRYQPTMGELNAFESAARHGSFTRAAEELDLAQSAISRQIRNLEDKLGVELFERIRQRVVLTTSGRLYLTEVKAVLSKLNDASRRIMSLSGYTEVINLAVLPTFATRWLLPRLPEFTESHPGLIVNLETRLTAFNFADTSFDAAIHYGSSSWPGAQTYHLFNEEMVPVASPKYRNKLELNRPEDLLKATLLHQSTRPDAWQEWFYSCSVKEAPLRGWWFEQFAMVAQAATSGLGAALLPRFLIDEELSSGRLTILFGHSLSTAAAYYVAVPDGKKQSAELLTSWLVKAAKAFSNNKKA